MRAGKNSVRAGVAAAALLLTLFFSTASPSPAFDNSQLLEDAEGGDRDARYTLAHQYLKGRGGLPKDREKAVHWFEKSADGGHRDAAFDLAILLLESAPEGGNRSQALIRMQQAAENGHAEAQYMLGMAHWQDDPETAAGWLAKAVGSGRRGAAEKLELLCGEQPLLTSCGGGR